MVFLTFCALDKRIRKVLSEVRVILESERRVKKGQIYPWLLLLNLFLAQSYGFGIFPQLKEKPAQVKPCYQMRGFFF